MNCYNHNNEVARGICKNCAKGICIECLIDTKEGLSCSEQCTNEIKEYNQMTNKAKELYGVGKVDKQLPLSVIMFGIIGLIYTVISIFNSTSEDIDILGIVFGITFMGIAFISYLRSKKLGTNF